MKNTRSFALLITAALILSAAIWLWHRARVGVGAQATTGGTNYDSEVVTSIGKTRGQLDNNYSAAIIGQASTEQQRKLAEMGITPDMTKEQIQQRVADWANTRRESIAENWRKTIEFYGRVVDQSGQPVSGANVHLIWTDTSPSGSSEANKSTDSEGAFSLSGTTGRLLQVWISKDGYYTPKTNRNNFDYAAGYMADPSNPIIFHLLRKGAGTDLITSQAGMARTLDFSASTRDGSPVRVDLFNRKVGTDGQIEVSQNKPAYGAWQTATGWSYRLTIPDGGFVETTDEFPFEAPESGYQQVVEFKFQKGTPDWTERIEKSFYIAFGSPRRYGRIRVETSMTTGTILEYAINPTGSRYLEPK